MKKIRIKSLPKAQEGMNFRTPAMNSMASPFVFFPENGGSEPGTSVNETIKPTSWEHANMEAEKGETVVTNLNKTGIPEFYKVGGKRHYEGGTPLNLPDESFIFSRDRNMKIKDPEILKMFGKSTKDKKGFTPADLSKKYNLNDYQKILMDPDTDKLQRKTAEMMIQNYNNKLGALAMAQESLKGFPDGIPGIAMPYIENMDIHPEDIVKSPPVQQVPMQQLPMKFGGIKKFQTGGATGGNPSTSDKATRVQDIPKDAVKWDQSAAGYDETQIQPGDYVKKADGKWHFVRGYKAAPYTGNFQDPRLAGKLGDLQEAYGRLEQTITSNPDLQKAIVTKYQENMASAKPNTKTGLTAVELEKAKNLPENQIIGNFLEMQKQVMAVNAHMGDMSGVDPKDRWDKDRKNYTETISTLGFQPLDVYQQAAFQGAYISLQDIAKDEKYKKVLEDFNILQVGSGDEKLRGKENQTVSDIDGWVGNTTIGQAALYKPVLKDLEMEEAKWKELAVEDERAQGVKHLNVNNVQKPAEWWLQDVVKTAGAARDFFGIKKYQPWQATPGVYLPNPTFMDPTRALAANAEVANIATQGAGAFSGPQAFSARSAQIQGKAAQNAADVLSQVHNQNVGIANQFEMTKAQILNQASDKKAQLATQLYDKNVILNQQFDNAKNQARQNLRQNYVDAITNRAQTQTLNQLYDQYQVDPTTGGFMYFTDGRPVTPTQANKTGVMDKFQEYKRLNPGVDDSTIYKMAAADLGVPQVPGSQFGVDPSEFAYPMGIPSGFQQ